MYDDRSFGTKAVTAITVVWLACAFIGVEIRAYHDPYAPHTLQVLQMSYDMLVERAETNLRRLKYN